MERQIAILTENFAGKWPFWLSPRQAMIVPVGPVFYEYARDVREMNFQRCPKDSKVIFVFQVHRRVRAAGFCCDVDCDDSSTMNKKVRNAQLAQFNFIFGES